MNRLAEFEADIDRLILSGTDMLTDIQIRADPKLIAKFGMSKEEAAELPDFVSSYQGWYSEALALVSQLLPERVGDFKSYYSPQAARKGIYSSTYTISDYLRGSGFTSEKHVLAEKASTLMFQQTMIIEGLRNRLKSTLYDIRTIVHADILDDEIAAARELNAKGFQRGAGAVAGVVLEGHLSAVCDRHAIQIRKKDPSISDLNDALKNANVIDTAAWRFVQHLGDIRNKCDHKKAVDPTKLEVSELIDGVDKVTKTFF